MLVGIFELTVRNECIKVVVLGAQTMDDHPDHNEPYAELILAHIFRCKVCKQVRNKNRRRLLTGIGTWKNIMCCDECYNDLHNLEA